MFLFKSEGSEQNLIYCCSIIDDIEAKTLQVAKTDKLKKKIFRKVRMQLSTFSLQLIEKGLYHQNYTSGRI